MMVSMPQVSRSWRLNKTSERQALKDSVERGVEEGMSRHVSIFHIYIIVPVYIYVQNNIHVYCISI